MTFADPTTERRAVDQWREKMEEEVAENTRVTLETKAKVDEVYDILVAAKGFFKVANWVGTAVKWCTGIVVAISAGIALYFQISPKK